MAAATMTKTGSGQTTYSPARRITWWTMQAGEWLEEATVRENLLRPVIAVDAGGLIYTAGADPPVTPKLSRAPGTYDGYRGVRTSSNALAITSQANLIEPNH